MNCGWYDVVVIHELSKCHKSQPGASDDACVLLPSSNLVRKHGLMAQNEAEGPKILKIVILLLKFWLKNGIMLDNL